MSLEPYHPGLSTIDSLSIKPPSGVDFALNPLQVPETFLFKVKENISLDSINEYYNINTDWFINETLRNIARSEDINFLFFRGIRDSLVFLIKNLKIKLVIFPESSYPGNIQVCKYLNVNFMTYKDSSHLRLLSATHDSLETLIIWEDPGNPEHRGVLDPVSIKKSYVFIDCAYRFPSLNIKENSCLNAYLRDRFYLAFGFSKSTAIPSASLSFLVSKMSFNTDMYPVKWDIFQASVAKTLFADNMLGLLYDEVYKKCLDLYKEKELYLLGKKISIYSRINPCFITVDAMRGLPVEKEGKSYPNLGLQRIPLK